MIALFLYQTKYYHKTEIFLNKNQSKALSLWNQCYLRCQESMSFIIKYRAEKRKIKGQFNTSITTAEWI